MMVEAGAWELPEDIMLEAIKFGHRELQTTIKLQKEMLAAVGASEKKIEFTPPPTDEALKNTVKEWLGDRLRASVRNADKTARVDATATLRQETTANFTN